MRLPLAFLPAFLLVASPALAADDRGGLEFFEKKIRPLLVEQCYGCHSAEAKKRRGGLVLDTRDAIRKGGDTGPAVVPGKPEDSLLLQVVKYIDRIKMPPKGKLPAAAVADLEQWIKMGAPDPREKTTTTIAKGMDIEARRKFWAFQPPRLHPVPAVHDAAWPHGDVDRFLLARLEASKLRPAADAERAVLLRRVYFDLIGLPPTPEQIDAFVADKSPDAFEKVVDGLLASPHFGERWGRHWLDVARYADSSGGGRSLLFPDAWRYRDYVIEAFNKDKPYNRFVKEQIAGDLLPYQTAEERRAQLTATAFLALGPTNYESQDKDILEMDVIDEQLDSIGRTFLGLTIGCARCHDHKFDPIPTRDYYSMAGVFKSTHTLIHDNVSRWVDLPLPATPEQEALIKKHDAQVQALKERIQIVKEAERKAGKTVAVAKGVVAPKDLPGIVLDDTQAKRVGEWKVSKYGGSYIGDGALYDDRSAKGDRTLTFIPDFPKTGRYEVRLAYIAHENRDRKVPVHILHLDGEKTLHVDMQKPPPIDGRFISLGTYRFNTNGQWYVLISNEGTTGHISVDALQLLPEEDEKKDDKKVEKPEKTNKPTTEDSKKLEDDLKKLIAAAPARPLAMGVEEAKQVGDFYVCIRGNTHNRGEKAPRGFLQVLTTGKPPAIRAQESGRRELAEWLARPDNPLTARVLVNRVWRHVFGAGLVRTVDEFGAVGETPSHPELLDYLALRFMEDGWSIKKLVRSLVLSHAYQTSSAARTDGVAADPENRLLWRMNRRRLEAECLRDAALCISGNLDAAAGGPTIRKGTASEYTYQFSETCRSVYVPVFRNKLPELFEAFDFPDPNLVVGRRNVSTVSTQALFLMNNPFVMEQARSAARAALKEGTDDARLERAYRTTLGRLPTEREKSIALAAVAGKTKPEERLAAWERLYQALFASMDFRYVY
jgi:hypothetical protein